MRRGADDAYDVRHMPRVARRGPARRRRGGGRAGWARVANPRREINPKPVNASDERETR